MPLHLHRAQRSDALVAGLADVLLAPLADPMATEIIAVPARGIERWLTQRLSHALGATEGADGVCANVDFRSPTVLVERALSIASGIDPDDDPWQLQRMVWPLLATIDECVGEPWCATLADHLGAVPPEPGEPDAAARTELRRSRRLAVAARLAGLFDSYSSYRPAVLQAWAAGADTDGYGVELPDQRRWQPELFRRLRAAIGSASPAERLDAVCAALRADPALLGLPDRLSVFGPTRLSAQELAVLDAVASHRDVHIWIPQPSPTLWAALAHDTTRTVAWPIRRRDDPTAGAPEHPLLRSLGRDSREFQLRLMSCTSMVIDHLHPELGRSTGVLGRLQQDLAGNLAPPGPPLDGGPDRRPHLEPGDDTIQVHACHGRDRQVEVLRDVLVGLLADDESLQPRDILVMCPDIELYAPLILAAFGVPGSEPAVDLDGSHPGTRIRVRLADRALRRTNPVLDVLARLLELVDSRMSASEVLDFAALAPVRRRFGFDDDDLQRLREWVIAAGIRWGLNDRGRAGYGLAALKQNTWRTGLDRILLGVAMSEDEPNYLNLALPLDDVDSSDIDLTGRLAELVDRLALAARDLTSTRPLTEWVSVLTAAVGSFAAVSDADSWQLDQAQRTLRETADDAGPRAGRVPLRLADVTSLFADALRGRPTRANFRTGELTICSMVPMRSVPHRVVCLMGLDDGEFPRTGRLDGDDVLGLEPVVGERDRTSEDRQLMLDAINAATEHLVVLYSGADDRTGAQRPPAAALGEVLDVLDAGVRAADGGPARGQLLRRHPLQPFDRRNFEPDRSGGAPISFDAAALAGARAAADAPRRGGAAGPAVLLPRPLPPRLPDPVVELADLIRFFEHPAKAFLRDRLGLAGSWSDDEVEDELSVGLDSLQEWAIGERLLQQQLSGAPAAEVMQAEFRRGTLPPGRQATVVLRRLSGTVAPLVDKAAGYIRGSGEQHDVSLALPGGRALTGTVGPLRDRVLTTVTYSKVGAKQRLKAWVAVLALAAADPGFAPVAVTIGRGSKYQPVRVSRLTPPPADRAKTLLQRLIQIRDIGLNIPVPLPPKTAMTYVEARRLRGRTPEQAMESAARDWAGDRFGGEGDDAEHRMLWGAVDLTAAAAALGDPDGASDEAGRWGQLAEAVYRPLLDAEVIDS
jgi:exodeoxyribonuclease V gamma subunit